MPQSTQQSETRQFSWRLNFKVLALVAFFLPLTIALGIWQLERAEEKRQLLDAYHQRQQSAPANENGFYWEGDLQYRRLTGKGSFDNDHSLLLDHRMRQGQPGYEVITPFRFSGSKDWILVNRGWLPASLARNDLPAVPDVHGEISILGHLYQSPGKPFVLGEEQWGGQWPQVLQNLDTAFVSKKLGERFKPWVLRLDEGSAGGLDIHWEIINVQPEKHTGYAVQWFAMAFMLVVMAVFANSNLGALFKSTGEK